MPIQVDENVFVGDLISALVSFSGQGAPMGIRDAALSVLGSLFQGEVEKNKFKLFYYEYALNFNSLYCGFQVQDEKLLETQTPINSLLTLHYNIFSPYYTAVKEVKSILGSLVKLDALIDDENDCFINAPFFLAKYFRPVANIRRMAYEALDLLGIHVGMMRMAHDRQALFQARLLEPLQEALEIIKGREDFKEQFHFLVSLLKFIEDFSPDPDLRLERESDHRLVSSSDGESEFTSGYEFLSEPDSGSEFKSQENTPRGNFQNPFMSQSQLACSPSISVFDSDSHSDMFSHSSSDSGHNSFVAFSQAGILNEFSKGESQEPHRDGVSSRKRQLDGDLEYVQAKRTKRNAGISGIQSNSKNNSQSHLCRI